MLNQLTNETEVKAHSEKSLTTFTIPVGLHPKDIDKILDGTICGKCHTSMLNEDDFEPCSDCDGHDACADFGCAIKAGIIKPSEW